LPVYIKLGFGAGRVGQRFCRPYRDQPRFAPVTNSHIL
jgi:hypothetical protein